MECEKIRDRFSSLLEGELNPLEERVVREHLTSCPECQKDLEKLQKTIRWLHSIEEAEVPDGFLSEIHEKIEDQKRRGLTAGRVRPVWFDYLNRLKLPVQAVAMVAIVFLALYVTKMMPVGTPDSKKAERTTVSQPEIKMEAKLVTKEADEKRDAAKRPSEAPPPKDIEQQRTSVTPLPKAEAPAVASRRFKEAAGAVAPSAETGKVEKRFAAEQEVFLAPKPPQEITLRISDREKALSQLHQLVKQFGGEIVKEEGNILLASLPTASFSEFKQELIALSPPRKTDQMVLQKRALEGKGIPPEAMQKEVESKSQEPPKPLTDKESRISVRILLTQE